MNRGPGAELESVLRAVVLCSGDVLPERLRPYLHDLARRGSAQAQAEAFLCVHPLADHLCVEYVDFALSVLLRRPAPMREGHPNDGEHGPLYEWHGQLLCDDDWEVRLSREWKQPSPLSGPFLFVLRRDESQGLRLVTTLLDTATQRWRERQQNPFWRQAVDWSENIRTPLPMLLELPSGLRQFWGDGQVFWWRRAEGRSMGPIAAALQALELWMMEEIQAGREPEELFLQVLAKSECVAVPNACLQVTRRLLSEASGINDRKALECLRAVFPLVCCPHVWRMDWEVRHLAAFYTFLAERKVQSAFRAAVKTFRSKPPLFFEEEKADKTLMRDIREQMTECRMWASKSNYQLLVSDGEQLIQWLPPEAHLKRHEATLATIDQRAQLASLKNWALQVLKGEPEPSLSHEQALVAAKSLQQPDFSQSYKWGFDEETLRREGLAGVAAAVMVAHFDWAQEHGHVPWCRDILLAAADGPFASDEHEGHVCYPSGAKVLAACGLCALLQHDTSDVPAKEQLLRLTASDVAWIIKGVFEGIKPLWNLDSPFCWSLLLLRFELCILPMHRALSDENRRQMIEAASLRAQSGIYAEPPSLDSSNLLFVEALFREVLPHLPLHELQGPHLRQQFVHLFDGLLNWTMRTNIAARSRRPSNTRHLIQKPLQWNRAFFNMAARLVSHIEDDDVQTRILTPVLDAWAEAPHPTATFLHGLMQKWLDEGEVPPPREVALWKAAARHVLTSQEIRALRGPFDYMDDRNEALALIVFCSSFQAQPWPSADWRHIGLFEEVIGEWVETLHHSTGACRYLLAMLEGCGGSFWPQPAISWLLRFAQGGLPEAMGNAQMWSAHGNGERAAKLLLQITAMHSRLLGLDDPTLKQCALLTDVLVEAGVPLASRIQKQLERRHHAPAARAGA